MHPRIVFDSTPAESHRPDSEFGSGYLELGYSRFALDFLPVWLAVVAPHTRGGWRAWFTLAAAAWGLLYFHEIVPDVEAWDV